MPEKLCPKCKIPMTLIKYAKPVKGKGLVHYKYLYCQACGHREDA